MSKTDSYIRLRNQGMSYADIARKYGVSRQAVYSQIKRRGTSSINIKPSTVVFLGLRQWMRDNHIFVSDLERMTGRNLRKALSSGNISLKGVTAILAATGLSYEQAFNQ